MANVDVTRIVDYAVTTIAAILNFISSLNADVNLDDLYQTAKKHAEDLALEKRKQNEKEDGKFTD